jgi:hypothetical protein
MQLYEDGVAVQVGDRVTHHGVHAIVESIHDAAELVRWGLEEEPGFMIVCDQCGRVLINPGSYDWEDVSFVARAS